MPFASANGIEICYDVISDPARPEDDVLVLIRGLGSQLTRWDPGFCEMPVERGFRVIRFDDRDVGLTTKLDDAGAPPMDSTDPPPYTLSDMAADVVGLLDHLDIDRAHIAGMSMGGMIGQVLAIEHPERVLSLCSIMSSPGGADAEPPREEAMAIFLVPRPETRGQAIEQAVASRRVIGSPGFPFDEQEERASATEALPGAWPRIVDAIATNADRSASRK